MAQRAPFMAAQYTSESGQIKPSQQLIPSAGQEVVANSKKTAATPYLLGQRHITRKLLGQGPYFSTCQSVPSKLWFPFFMKGFNTFPKIM